MAVSFIDEVILHLAAGNGGNGCVSVRREKFKPLAGPDGGNGGNGASIILVADPSVTTLLSYHRHPHYSAQNGGFGMGDNRSGAQGEDIELSVPVGTVVRDADGTALVDLDQPGMRFVVAEGGRGGLGNAALASTKRKAPGFALLGTPGWSGDVVLEYKVLADVALVGYPSAGKSSLIAALSAARPKIADYPFTTLTPNLGVVQAGNTRYTIADVPGLIEGASEGRGLGLEFLRHVERCAALLHVIDCATLEPGRDPLSDFAVIRSELANYRVPKDQVPLRDRPQLIALNKIDVPEAQELADFVQADLEAKGFRVFQISTVARTGLKQLSFALAELVEASRSDAPETASEPRIVLRPKPVDRTPFTIAKDSFEGTVAFRITGEKPERWVAQTDFTNDEAIGYLADRLARLGVEDGLFKAGAIPGSTVIIGAGDGVIFDWEPAMTSAAEVVAAPRGTDPRVNPNYRPTRSERRDAYYDRMDAKAAARAELAAEGEAGIWRSPEDFEPGAAESGAAESEPGE